MSNKVEFSRIQELVSKLQYIFVLVPGTTTTLCVARLPNGFTVGRGESACVDPANYDKALGEKYAKERAVADATNQLRLLEGYVLASKLNPVE